MKNIQDENYANDDLASLMAMDREKEQEFIQSEATKLSKLTDILIDSAIEVVQSRKKYILDDRDILFLDAIMDKFITVEQLLNEGEKYHYKEFIEPLSSKSMVRSQEFSGVKKTCRFKWSVAYPIITGNDTYNSNAYRFDRFNKINSDKKFRFIEAAKLSCHHTDWLICDYIEAEKVVLFFGPPASFKSFVVIDMGLSIAAGHDWHGHKVSQGSVLYICGEGQSGIHKRIMAWEKYHNQSSDNFLVSSSPVQILLENSLQEIETAAKNVIDIALKPKLIIIDTLNRNFGDGDENSTLDMTRFIKGIDRLSHRLKCTIIIVHHSGLGDTNRGRGSSALLGAMDFEYSCKVENGLPGGKLVTLRSTKTKDHEPPESKVFQPHNIEIGTDEDGNSISSVVLIETSQPAKDNKLSKGYRIALDALKTAISNGDPSEDAWKAEAYEKNITSTDKLDSKRKAFDRAKKYLLDQGLIEVKDDGYMVI